MGRMPRAVVAVALAIVAAVAFPQPRSTPKVAFLGVDREAQAPRFAAFIEGMRALGYENGRNVVIEGRWADGKFERLPALAQELVDARVDVIVTPIPAAIDAARRATTTIPIVVPILIDPERTGLVKSLSHPGGNITGLAFQDTATGVKRLELFRQMVPGFKRLAIVQQPGGGTDDEALKSFVRAAQAMGLLVKTIDVAPPPDTPDFEKAVAVAKAWGADGVFQSPAFYTTTNRQRFMQLLAAARLPAACEGRHYAVDGCLMSYNGSFEAAHRAAATYVDRILKEARPADLPVDQARDFEFVINMKTAQALGIAIPPQIRVQATETVP